MLLIYIVIYFILAFVNIVFALIGLLCFTIPFVILYKYRKNNWCRYYCPRANMFTRIFSKISFNKKVTKKSINEWKQIVLYYFIINIIFIVLSSVMVGIGRIQPLEYLRFIIVFQVPVDVPQLISLGLHPVILHLSYRVFSVMFTSIIIGIIIGIVYFLKAWCTVCPMKQALNSSK